MTCFVSTGTSARRDPSSAARTSPSGGDFELVYTSTVVLNMLHIARLGISRQDKRGYIAFNTRRWGAEPSGRGCRVYPMWQLGTIYPVVYKRAGGRLH